MRILRWTIRWSILSSFGATAIGRLPEADLIIVAAILLSVALPSRATCATAQPSRAQSEAWRASMTRVPMSKGCFRVTYPNTQWQQVACTTAPLRRFVPALGPRPGTVGGELL